ncbi:helix-turn-helix transcriptional regulator [Leisingera sp. ANG-M7]|uniref:helix-turn-helix transcriptional regulator n=1 Tax=Leisingera sp. ANG-M7 TaxID=1577902 RepID=UPI00057F8BE5|nr:LuxR family transcriptional regulator [Leisingera sp. ANG-M7]KIC35884.1 LuxR family transcriptional regulator [Leisingera sp. ANG-M7]
MRSDIRGVLLRSLDQLSECGYSIGIGFNGIEPVFVHSTYSQRWIDRYVDQGYLLVDPTIQFGLSSTGQVTWRELERLFPSSKTFFEDAVNYGLHHGNTLAISADGRVSVLSCSGPEWSSGDLRIARAALHALHALEYEPSNPVTLTEPVREVLRLMCSGCKDQEIADRLGVKLETVRARRRTAQHAFEAKTSAQLISQVIKFGLI